MVSTLLARGTILRGDYSITLDKEAELDSLLARNGITVGPSLERVALVSLWFNGHPTFNAQQEIVGHNLVGPNLLNALKNGDRTEAWYKIRYRTNRDDIPGIANRRYFESDEFKLYNENPTEEDKAAYRVYTRHKDTSILNGKYSGIQDYEDRYNPANAGTTGIEAQLLPATTDLLQRYGNGVNIAWDHIQVGEDAATVYFKGTDAETLTGTAQNDLIFGESGSDTVTAGAGDDVLYGGTGSDVYYYNPGGGNDIVIDEDHRGVLVYQDDNAGIFAQLIGGKRKTSDPANVYTDKIGGKTITYTANGADLRITISGEAGSITVKNFNEGDLNIQFDTLPTPVNNTTTHNILGDFAPKDFDPNTAGVQTQTDSLGNIITTSVTQVRADTLFDSTGNDLVEGRGGDDFINAFRGGNDVLDGGAGSDIVDSGSGNDIVIAGAGADVAIGGAGVDEVYAEQKINLDAAIAQGETQLASGCSRAIGWMAAR